MTVRNLEMATFNKGHEAIRDPAFVSACVKSQNCRVAADENCGKMANSISLGLIRLVLGVLRVST
jgi:hypothetical protein